MVLVGYSLALMMGLTLGLIGAGGSILTVPILVYFLNVKPIVATGYSLLVVGTAALYASITYWRRGEVSLQTAVTFAIPSMLSVLLMRTVLIPAFPESLWGIPKDNLIMLLFAMLMILASIFMSRPIPEHHILNIEKNFIFYIRVVTGSMGVGLLTGLVGAGGGFLIMPSLIAFFGLGVKQAIGTSLAIITINSLVGFNGDIHSGIPLDWSLLVMFLSCTLVGITAGVSIGKHISAAYLKRLFAFFILFVSVLVLIQEFRELY